MMSSWHEAITYGQYANDGLKALGASLDGQRPIFRNLSAPTYCLHLMLRRRPASQESRGYREIKTQNVSPFNCRTQAFKGRREVTLRQTCVSETFSRKMSGIEARGDKSGSVFTRELHDPWTSAPFCIS